MSNNWRDLIPNLGGRFADSGACAFEDSPAAASQTVAAGPVMVPLTHLGILSVTGNDAASFLHNLFTNDVKGIGTSDARRNGLCTAKGRMLASVLMWRKGESVLLQMSSDILPGVLKKLSMYVLRAKAQLADVSDAVLSLGIGGPAAGDVLARAGLPVPGAAMQVTPGDDGVQVIRIEGERFLVVAPGATMAVLWPRLSAAGFRPAGTSAWRWLEAENGIPLVTGPVQEEFVPQMVNFDLIGGVSFTKGCYPGQEIVARMKYLGKLKKRMFLGHVETESEPAPGADLFSPELDAQSAGKVVFAAAAPGGGFDVLAVCQLASREADAVTLGAPNGPRLSFRPLPYSLE